MTFRQIIFFIVLVVTSCVAQAAKLTGTLTDTNGEPLGYASVYVKGTTNGTSTNLEGRYVLNLNEGVHQVVYRYIGYKTHTQEVKMGSTDRQLNVQLKSESVTLTSFSVYSGDEDPAYGIIRNAIKNRKKHLNEVQSYSCSVYIKGMQELTKAPKKLLGQEVIIPGTDTNNTGVIYLSESVSNFTYENGKIKETMVSSKVSGSDQAFSWNRAIDMNITFYKNVLQWDGLMDRGMVSPISDNALIYYQYKLLGSYEEDGQVIHKVKVIPRRKEDPVFRGNIYITEGSWRIHSTDLMLTKEAKINFVDSLKINQVYIPVADTLWMVGNQKFSFKFNIFGFRGEGNFVGVYSDYEIGKTFEKKHFNNEVWTVDEEANQKDSAYWNKARPIPLVEQEVADYKVKDSLKIVWESKEYKDSIDRKNNKFKVLDLLRGYNWENSYNKLLYETSSLVNLLQFNTIEGWVLDGSMSILKRFEPKQTRLRYTQFLRYGFSSNVLYAKGRLLWSYNRKIFGRVGAEGGKYVSQYNEKTPISPFANTLYSLLGEDNYMKLYEKSFLKLWHTAEVTNGVVLWFGMEYAQRSSLVNRTTYSWNDIEDKEYSSNNPWNTLNDDFAFEQHELFLMELRARFRINQKYFSRPYRKFIIGSKWPTFHFSYRKAIPGFAGSDIDYDFIGVGISDEMDMKLFGRSEYNASYGIFLRKGMMEFMDFVHFDGNRTIFYRNRLSAFQLLDYYTHSTNNQYVEAHFEHHFRGFLFNKIPYIRKLKLHAAAGVDFVYSDTTKEYFEISVGIENIGRIGKVEFVQAFGSKVGISTGFRLGLAF